MKKSGITMISLAMMIMTFTFSLIVITSCEKEDDIYIYEDMGEPFENPQYTTTQTVSPMSS
ncbi:MAG TPA: hypothetical protein PK816_17875 [Candidatus Cloacimonadota bacterium]|nr:hypothetical protein [Candidatus Cloacimonadota bacterium]